MSLEGEQTTTVETTPSLMDAPPAADTTAADTQTEEKPDGAEGNPAPADDGSDTADADGGTGDSGDSEGLEDGEDKDEAPEGAPDEYADFVAPEGVDLDPEAMEAFRPVAKELNLTQEQAQRLVDLQSETAQRWAQAVQQHVIDTRTGWREAAAKDPVIGGEKFAENLAIAKEGRDLFGEDAELKELLDSTGLGDHPAVIRHFFNVGNANREHDFVKSGKPEKSKSFYDHPTSKK